LLHKCIGPLHMMHRPPSRTSFSHVLSQNETWWSLICFRWNSNDVRCRRRCCWFVQDVRLQDCCAQVTPGLANCCENACWRVMCKCMLDIRCSVLREWSCPITKSFEFWLRTVEKMGLILSHMRGDCSTSYQA